MIGRIGSVLWGDMTVIIIVLCGGYLTVKSRFIQFRLLRLLKGNGSSDRRSRTRAVTSALAASLGTGNISGCAAALAVGGRGAVFWMWVSALLGMGAAYWENYLGAEFGRRLGKKPSPVIYMKCGLGMPKTAAVWSAGIVGCSITMGCAAQSAALSSAVSDQTGIPPFAASLAAALLTAAVILAPDGLNRVMDVTEKLVPFMGIAYIAGCTALLIAVNADIPSALESIFADAFALKSAAGGAAGYGIRQAVSAGLRRGVFSNEAGMGSSVLVHAEGNFGSPETVGAWAAFEVFLDTIVCCTFTALAVICSPVSGSITDIFGGCFGKMGGAAAVVCICLFAWASMLGWYVYGEKSLDGILMGAPMKTKRLIFGLLFTLSAACAGFFSERTVLETADIFNGFVLLPNIIAVTVIVASDKNHQFDKV